VSTKLVGYLLIAAGIVLFVAAMTLSCYSAYAAPGCFSVSGWNYVVTRGALFSNDGIPSTYALFASAPLVLSCVGLLVFGKPKQD